MRRRRRRKQEEHEDEEEDEIDDGEGGKPPWTATVEGGCTGQQKHSGEEPILLPAIPAQEREAGYPGSSGTLWAWRP
eukprot:1894755-Pyramimonas_sp.AAC.1